MDKENKRDIQKNDLENILAIWMMIIGFIVVFCINVFK